VNDRLTVPNILTALRIVMAAAAVVLALHAMQALAVSLCIAAALLDVFDGWYARTFARGSFLGQHLDPLADKLLMGVVFAWIGIDAGSVIVWGLIALVALREVGMTLLRAYSRRLHGRFIPASRLGRAKMLAQSVFGLTILGITHFLGEPVPVPVVAVSLIVIAIISYVSVVAYVRVWVEEGTVPACGAEPVGEDGAGTGRRVSAVR